MVRLILFLLLVGGALWAVARVMGMWREDLDELPPPDEIDDGHDDDPDDKPR